MKEQYYARIQREGTGDPDLPSPLENHKAIGFHINTGPGPLENKKSYQTSHWNAM